MRDFRFALQILRRSPGFAMAAVCVMALGIGANTAVFSAVYAVLLKPLGYRDPSRLVVTLHDGRFPVSPADFLDYRKQSTAFEAIGAAQSGSGSLPAGNHSEIVPGLRITANIIPLLGVQPILGRSFSAAEEKDNVVLISYGLWQRKFGADPGIAGRTILLDGKPTVVTGVMPADFQFAPFWVTNAEMWRPFDVARRAEDRSGRSLRVFARLRPGVSIEQAQTQMSTIAARLATAHPDTNAGLGISVVSLTEKVVGPIRPTLLLLLGTAGFVLIIACADIANLLLARAAGRRKEIATRIALGATRFQLVRQLSVESLLLSAMGGVLGVALARYGLELLRAALPEAGIPRQTEIALDGAVLLFALGVSVVSGLIAGVIPALQASRVDVNETLKEGGRSVSDSRGMRRTQRVLVTAQVALALVLLMCAGLLLRSLRNLNSVNAGFNPHRLVTFEMNPPAETWGDSARREALFQKTALSLAGIPGVESVSAINHIPIGGDVWTYNYEVVGRPVPLPGHEFGAVYRVIRPNYFATMQTPLARGRDITPHDDEHAPPVVIINEALARRQWPSGDPIGQRIRLPERNAKPVELTIIGVAKDVRQSDWTGPAAEEMYFPYAQRLTALGSNAQTFVIRTRNSPDAVAASIERNDIGIDADVPISPLRTMDQIISDKLWRSRVSTMLLSGFAAIALLLAAAGIYSVISYTVRRRTHELGIRMALGASRGSVLRMVYRESFGPVLAGIGMGAAGSFAAVQSLRSLLYNVGPADPVTFVLVVICLITACAAAISWPAWRAVRFDPLRALRDL
ncbi:MAG TPA: ABC transporter permease [Bryobacteraceae bacterium]|nr:ABC transporter permease [Bryobacteraceae bacterium]